MGSDIMCHIACSTVCSTSRHDLGLITSAACNSVSNYWIIIWNRYIFFSAKLLSLSAFQEFFLKKLKNRGTIHTLKQSPILENTPSEDSAE